MKKMYLLSVIIIFGLISCERELNSPTQQVNTNGETSGLLEKSGTPTVIALGVSEHYRESNGEWCVGMRVFGFNELGPVSMPSTGYVWEWDITPNNGSEDWVVWPRLVTVRSSNVDGMMDPNQTMSRYKFRVRYGNLVTDVRYVGMDLRNSPITGCGIDAHTAPDNAFFFYAE